MPVSSRTDPDIALFGVVDLLNLAPYLHRDVTPPNPSEFVNQPRWAFNKIDAKSSEIR
jgi:hypothetical protein